MARIDSTRLRAFRSKDLGVLLTMIDKFTFKIEIKGNPVFAKGVWTVFGILPEDESPHLKKIPMISDFD